MCVCVCVRILAQDEIHILWQRSSKYATSRVASHSVHTGTTIILSQRRTVLRDAEFGGGGCNLGDEHIALRLRSAATYIKVGRMIVYVMGTAKKPSKPDNRRKKTLEVFDHQIYQN